jgi:AraC family ethanolamine operon transcriptional activator
MGNVSRERRRRLQTMKSASEGPGSGRSGVYRTHSPFDLYAAELRRRDILVMLVGSQQTGWHVDRCALDGVTLQLETEGARNVWIGVMPDDMVGFRLQKSAGSEPARANGCALAQGDIVVLPPGASFILSSGGASEWISVFLKLGGSRASGAPVFGSANVPLGEDVSIVSMAPVSVARFVELASCVRQSADQAEASRTLSVAELKRSLIDMLAPAMAARGHEPPRSMDRRLAGSKQIALSALAFIHVRSKVYPTVQSLCEASGTTERTLRRAFHAFFAMGPANFLKVYRLNQVRRTMLSEASVSLTVARLLASCSVSEFGRFAGEYRALFGELPSQTRKKNFSP